MITPFFSWDFQRASFEFDNVMDDPIQRSADPQVVANGIRWMFHPSWIRYGWKKGVETTLLGGYFTLVTLLYFRPLLHYFNLQTYLVVNYPRIV